MSLNLSGVVLFNWIIYIYIYSDLWDDILGYVAKFWMFLSLVGLIVLELIVDIWCNWCLESCVSKPMSLKKILEMIMWGCYDSLETMIRYLEVVEVTMISVFSWKFMLDPLLVIDVYFYSYSYLWVRNSEDKKYTWVFGISLAWVVTVCFIQLKWRLFLNPLSFSYKIVLYHWCKSCEPVILILHFALNVVKICFIGKSI